MNVASPTDPRIQLAVEFISSNLNHRLRISKLAALANLSVHHFCRLFRSQMGQTPRAYLRSVRMEKTARLLATSLLSIKEIMGMVGYNDKSDFSRDFKRSFGISPSEYRRQFLEVSLLRDRLLREERKAD